MTCPFSTSTVAPRVGSGACPSCASAHVTATPSATTAQRRNECRRIGPPPLACRFGPCSSPLTPGPSPPEYRERGEQEGSPPHLPRVHDGHRPVPLAPGRAELRLPRVVLLAQRRLPVALQLALGVEVDLDEVVPRRQRRLAAPPRLRPRRARRRQQRE